MKTTRKIAIVTFLIIILIQLLVPVQLARADVAPPGPPPGDGIQPFGEGNTMVQMMAEQVLIDVSDKIISVNSDPDEYDDWTGQLRGYEVSFEISFWMQNQGDSSESMAVRFPLNAFDGYGTFFRVNDFSVRVDGISKNWRVGKLYTSDPEIDHYNWAYFDVTFPPGEEVFIQVAYSTVTYSAIQIPLERIDYILKTGAGWYGPIEYGEIILKLPYTATPDTVLEEDSSVPSETAYFNGKAHWYFRNLEPEQRDNLQIAIIPPQAWQELIKYRAILEDDPENLSALIAFGNAATQLCIFKKVFLAVRFPDLYQEGLTALEKAAARLPQDLEVQTMYTNALIAQVGIFYRESLTIELGSKLAQQTQILRELDPDHELLNFLDSISDYYYQYLTATPTSIPSYTPSGTPIPTPSPTYTPAPPTETFTPLPSPTSTPTPTPEQVCVKQSNAIGWGVILLVFLVAGGIYFARMKSRGE